MRCIATDTDGVADFCPPPPKRPALQDSLRGSELSLVPTDSSELRDWSIHINSIMKTVIIYICIKHPMGIMIISVV